MQIGVIISAVATCALIVALAVGSNALLDRYLPAQSAAQDVAAGPQDAPCVNATGKWHNWPWPNVPALSPPCPPAKAGSDK